MTLIQKSPCHDVKLLRRGVNVFIDLQSTCDLCFAVVLHEKLPLRTCHVTMCTPQWFGVSKHFQTINGEQVAEADEKHKVRTGTGRKNKVPEGEVGHETRKRRG